MEIKGTITMYLNEDNTCEINVLNLAQNLINYPVEAYQNSASFGTISILWNNEKFEINDDLWSVCAGVLNTIINAGKGEKGWSVLDINYTEALSYQIIERNGTQWFGIIRQQAYEPRTVFEEKKFPLFSFIAEFLPVARAFFDYQIALRQCLKQLYSESIHNFWREIINKAQTFFDDNTAAYDAERGIKLE